MYELKCAVAVYSRSTGTDPPNSPEVRNKVDYTKRQLRDEECKEREKERERERERERDRETEREKEKERQRDRETEQESRLVRI